MSAITPFSQRLLQSKLTAPVGGRALVSRPRLIEWLQSAEHAKVVMLRAPAGFGKTTLMAQWLLYQREQGISTAWLTLDEEDNDPVRFLTYLIAAIENALPTSDPAGPEPDLISHGHNPTGVLLYLVDRLSALATPLTIFLDDFGAIQAPETLKLIQQLLQHLPPGKRVVITIRHLPQLSLARLRAQGHLAEIGHEGLRFSREETKEFIGQTQNLELDENEVESLYQSTEGWAAGIQLSTLSSIWREKKGRSEKTSFLAIDNISEYLAEDVLSGQPEDVQSFLVQTSILNRLSAPLCDAVTGLTGGERMLEYLESQNLFIVPLDEKRKWYRYHSLFAKFLLSRLERQGEHSPLERHRAASSWYAGAGYHLEAARHAMLANDQDNAAHLIEQCAFTFVSAGQMDTVVEWGGRLEECVLDRHIVLQLAYTIALIFRQQYKKALEIFERLQDNVRQSGHAADFVTDLCITRALILISQDNPGEAEKVLSEVMTDDFDVKGPTNARFLPAIFNIASNLNIIAERYPLARKCIMNSIRLSSKLPEMMVHQFYSKCFEGIICLRQGRLCEVLELTESAFANAEGISRYSSGATVLAVLKAEVLYEKNDHVKAEKLLMTYHEMLPTTAPSDIMMMGTRTLGRIHLINGDFNGALRLLGKLEQFGNDRGLPRAVATARQEQIRILLQRGDTEQALGLRRDHDDTSVWAFFNGRNMIANSPETPQVTGVRLLIGEKKYTEAMAVLKRELIKSDESGNYRQSLLLRILMAKALEAGGEKKQALAVLKEALISAQAEGFVRCFLDEGDPIPKLIHEIRKSAVTEDKIERGGVFIKYLDRLQHAMGGAVEAVYDTKAESGDLQLDPLTDREREIIAKLALGYSSNELAESLFISKYTVQYHLRNIYSKLGANNRVQAVALARRFGLIS